MCGLAIGQAIISLAEAGLLVSAVGEATVGLAGAAAVKAAVRAVAREVVTTEPNQGAAVKAIGAMAGFHLAHRGLGETKPLWTGAQDFVSSIVTAPWNTLKGAYTSTVNAVGVCSAAISK